MEGMSTGMRDIFLDGLKILDLLELTGSTAVTAALVNCDQSSVSRTYRRVSDELNLAFCKHAGRYAARNNHALLDCLRQAAQLHRLSQGMQRLQWVNHVEPERPVAWQFPCEPLPRSWACERYSLELLQRRVLDLVAMPLARATTLQLEAAQASGNREPFSLLHLNSGSNLAALVLPEHHQHRSLQAWLAAADGSGAGTPRILSAATA